MAAKAAQQPDAKKGRKLRTAKQAAAAAADAAGAGAAGAGALAAVAALVAAWCSSFAFLRALAEGAGITAHVYSSPHLCRFNERIRLAGRLIEDAALADLLEEVETVNGSQQVTFFEVTKL